MLAAPFMETILILTTGGTIDKVYFDARSTYEVGPPNVARLLAEHNLAVSYRIMPLLRKDSLELTTADRNLIRRTVEQAEQQRVLITHGTDTMPQTGEALLAIPEKTVVLTGALEPALFKTSDAPFNIGGALVAVQLLGPGVYIAMNGTVFTCPHVRKNQQAKRFENVTHAER